MYVQEWPIIHIFNNVIPYIVLCIYKTFPYSYILGIVTIPMHAYGKGVGAMGTSVVMSYHSMLVM